MEPGGLNARTERLNIMKANRAGIALVLVAVGIVAVVFLAGIGRTPPTGGPPGLPLPATIKQVDHLMVRSRSRNGFTSSSPEGSGFPSPGRWWSTDPLRQAGYRSETSTWSP